MQPYKIVKPFKGSPDGARVFDYERGDIVPNAQKPFSDDLATVAVLNKWARKHVPPKLETKKTEGSGLNGEGEHNAGEVGNHAGD